MPFYDLVAAGTFMPGFYSRNCLHHHCLPPLPSSFAFFLESADVLVFSAKEVAVFSSMRSTFSLDLTLDAFFVDDDQGCSPCGASFGVFGVFALGLESSFSAEEQEDGADNGETGSPQNDWLSLCSGSDSAPLTCSSSSSSSSSWSVFVYCNYIGGSFPTVLDMFDKPI